MKSFFMKLSSAEKIRKNFVARIKTAMIFFVTVMCFAALFIYGDSVKQGVKAGVELSLGVLVPSLFLPLVLCAMLQQCGAVNLLGKLLNPVCKKLFSCGGINAAIFLVCAVSGYPAGAVMCRAAYESGELTRNEAVRLAPCCVCAGPAFILLGVGDNLLMSRSAGIVLLLSHIISAVVLFVIGMMKTRRKNNKKALINSKNPPKKTFAEAITLSVGNSSKSMLMICAYAVIFSAVTAVTSYIGDKTGLVALTKSIIGSCEVTNACLYFAPSYNLPLIAAALGFSGLSVIAQICSALGELCDFKRIFGYRLLHAALSYITCTALMRLFPIALKTQAGADPTLLVSRETMLLSSLMLLGTLIFMYSAYQNSDNVGNIRKKE